MVDVIDMMVGFTRDLSHGLVLEDMSPAERDFYFIMQLDLEVSNGGLEQYYYNDSGEHAHQVVQSLHRIGAPATAAIVENANSFFGPQGPSGNRLARIAQLNFLPASKKAQWLELDPEIYDGPENLEQLLGSHLDENLFRLEARQVSASVDETANAAFGDGDPDGVAIIFMATTDGDGDDDGPCTVREPGQRTAYGGYKTINFGRDKLSMTFEPVVARTLGIAPTIRILFSLDEAERQALGATLEIIFSGEHSFERES